MKLGCSFADERINQASSAQILSVQTWRKLRLEALDELQCLCTGDKSCGAKIDQRSGDPRSTIHDPRSTINDQQSAISVWRSQRTQDHHDDDGDDDLLVLQLLVTSGFILIAGTAAALFGTHTEKAAGVLSSAQGASQRRSRCRCSACCCCCCRVQAKSSQSASWLVGQGPKCEQRIKAQNVEK